jgi:tetratricopeptide (TPR) repeat protein
MTPEGRPIRKVPNPELEGGEPVPVAPPRKGFSVEVGPKKPQTGRWVIAAALAVLVGLGILGAVLRWRDDRAAQGPAPATARPTAPAEQLDPAAARVRQDALALLARDDAASLERAAGLLDEALRKQTTSAARADRALAVALLSLDAREEAERLDGRARAAEEARAAAEASGDAGRASSAAHDAEGLRATVAPARERAARLAAEARAELDDLPADRQREPVVLRARAMALVAAGQRGDAARIARDARGAIPDPWITLAGILADLPDGAGAEDYARALERLDALSAAHPELVRAKFLAAKIRAGIGDTEGALAALDGVLKVNPDHLESKRLRAEVLAAVAPPAGALGPSAPAGGGTRGEPVAPVGSGPAD